MFGEAETTQDQSYGWDRSTLLEPINSEYRLGKVLKSLRVILAGHSVAPSSPYKIFYNMYEPSANFRKTTA
ncbi:hypothetical protein BDR07DRAFT_1446680 [Suillus spraguei]|nr:hypothetical protein BDR07DRAFT_1446680 [Suillus spraguei]